MADRKQIIEQLKIQECQSVSITYVTDTLEEKTAFRNNCEDISKILSETSETDVTINILSVASFINAKNSQQIIDFLNNKELNAVLDSFIYDIPPEAYASSSAYPV